MSDLIVVNENMQALDIYQPEKVKEILGAISKEVKGNEFDMSVAKDRTACASLAHKIARSKTFLDGLGKTLTAEWKEKAKIVDNQRKEIRDSLDSLKEEVRKPLTEFENKEKNRLAKCASILEEIKNFRLEYGHSDSSEQIFQGLKDLDKISITDFVGDEIDEVNKAIAATSEYLSALHTTVVNNEKEKAELEKLKKEKELRDQKDREERIAKEAAEKAKREAERLALEREAQIKKEKEAAEQREIELKRKIEQDKIDAENARKAAELKAEQDKIEARKRAEFEKQEAVRSEQQAAKAREDERIRLEQIEKQKEEKRIANFKHREKIEAETLQSLDDCINDMIEGSSTPSDIAAHIVQEIIKGNVLNISIKY